MSQATLERLLAQARALHQALPRDPQRAALHHHARRALIDWAGVCVGALREPEANTLRRLLNAGAGPVACFGGERASAAEAAWLHGTLSHLLDFDDTHVGSILHTSGPVWAALWAVGQAHAIDEAALLDAYVVAFQFGARLGGNGLGERLTRSGWHVTPVLGRLAGALAVSLARRLSLPQTVHAVALAATHAGGLTASFGALAKPLHAGAAARDAVFVAALAEAGATGAPHVLDGAGGLLQTLLQDPGLAVAPDLAAAPWEVAHNSFKPYASCQLTHASLDAARALADGGAPAGRVDAYVHPLAIQVAGRAQTDSSAQARFSLPYCIALGLAGFTGGAADFDAERRQDARVRDWMGRVTLHPDPQATRESARLVREAGGVVREHAVAFALGSVANPMDDAALRGKFLALTRPVLAHATDPFAAALARFGEPGSLARALAVLAGAGAEEEAR